MTSSAVFTLYSDSRFTSPYVMSAFVTLREKGLPFELKTVDLVQSVNRQPAYAALSLSQRVPLLVDGDFRLAESSAISEYLEESCPAVAVYPQGRHERALARQIQAWLRSDFMPIRMQRSTEVVFYQPSEQPLDEAGQQAAATLFAAAGQLLSHGGEHLFGKWCIADTDLALMLQRLLRNGDAVPPTLAAYAQRQWQRPSVQAWLDLPRDR